MTPLPKRRLSRARQGKRRQAIKKQLNGLSKCADCGQPILQHNVCPNCGKYKGKQIIKIHLPRNKKEK